MIRIIALMSTFFGALLYAGEQEPAKSVSGNLVLHISAKDTTLIQGQNLKITATITNKGQSPVTLVLPGDGSESAWRTPITGWSVVKAGKQAANHPQAPTLFRGGRCGNINCLKKDEVFVLRPGESKQLNEWVGSPPPSAEPGEYSVVFYFANEPALKWKGLPLGQHDPDAMNQVQKSDKCALVSNQLKFVVNPK